MNLEKLVAIILVGCGIIAVIETCEYSNNFNKAGAYNTIVKAVVTQKNKKLGSREQDIIHYKYFYNGVSYQNDDSSVELYLYNQLEIGDSVSVMINNIYPDFSLIYCKENKYIWNGENPIN